VFILPLSSWGWKSWRVVRIDCFPPPHPYGTFAISPGMHTIEIRDSQGGREVLTFRAEARHMYHVAHEDEIRYGTNPGMGFRRRGPPPGPYAADLGDVSGAMGLRSQLLDDPSPFIY